MQAACQDGEAPIRATARASHLVRVGDWNGRLALEAGGLAWPEVTVLCPTVALIGGAPCAIVILLLRT
jgi:hypothetical protein